jgi:hypothetical protein
VANGDTLLNLNSEGVAAFPAFRHPARFSTFCLTKIIAVGVNTDGGREVLGVDIGASEAVTFRTDLPHAS